MKKNTMKIVDIVYKNGVKQRIINKDIVAKIVKEIKLEKERI